MSNYNAAAAAKNPPWQQSNLPIMQGQQLNTGLLQYPQTALLQAQQLIQQVSGQQTQPSSMLYGNTASTNQHQAYGNTSTSNTGYNHLASASNVTYPTRQLNSTAFATSNTTLLATGGTNTGLLGSAPTTFPKQRVFTGTITKRQDNFGFVDEDVFFQIDVCAKGSNPRIGDKVLVEAAYNPSMPFKWNATRIQVLPIDRDRGSGYSRFSSSNNSTRYSPVGSNDDYKRRTNNLGDARGGSDSNRRPFYKRSPERSASTTDRKRRFDAVESSSRARSPRRESKERERSPGSGSTARRSRSTSPKRRRTRPTPRYAVTVPKFALDLTQADLLELRRRYSNMYIPSDFFISSAVWLEAFPPDRPFSLQHPCSFHVMPKEVESYFPNEAVLDPPDVDYLFSAKVMLLSMPKIDDVFKKCVTLGEDQDKEHKSCVHPSRLINFLVGTRGKSETMAIGGPWSESLDGANPDKDPSVLIRTAIRTTKALTGIDLSKCTKWFKFVELYYRRQETTTKGKAVRARVETVVIYVPDVWNCVPTQLEWDGLGVNYKKQFAAKVNKEAPAPEKPSGEDEKDTTMECDTSIVAKREPTHYSQLDIKNMKVQDLREELEARSLSSKGLKSQLTARLAKVLKQEQSEDDAKGEAEDEEEEDKAEGEEEKKNGDEGDAAKKEKDGDGKEKEEMSEKEKQRLERKYTLPEFPSIIVHPNLTAKSGKFNCEVMSLSLLLDYRFDDAKEHSFEVALFAELFNEMLMRDFGFQIFKAIHNAPEPVKEEKEDKEKEEKEKSNKTDDEKEKEKEEKSSSEETKDKEDKKEEKEEKKDKEKEGKDKKKDKDEKKKDREDREKRRKEEKEVKTYTENPFLLLCCVYFDTTHIGYMYDKDLEDLLLTLGLSLSRSQVKKLVQKVLSKERNNFNYRKLTDKPLVEGTEKTTLTEIKLDIDILKQLIEGNRKFLPVFVDPSSVGKSPKKGGSKGGATGVEGMVMYQGSVVDIGNLQASLEKSEIARLDTETSLMKLRSEHTSLEKSANKLKDKLASVSGHLEKVTVELKGTKERLVTISGTNEQLMQVLEEIHEKVGGFVVKPKLIVEKEEKKEETETKEESEMKEHKTEENGIEGDEEKKEELKEDEVKVKDEPMEDESK